MPASPSPTRRHFTATLAGLVAWPGMSFHAASARAAGVGRLLGPAAGGPMVTEQRAPGRFSGLRLSTGAKVVITPGDRHGVGVTAERDLLPLIETFVEDGVLVLRDRRSFASAEALLWARRSLRVSVGGSCSVRWYGVDNASVTAGGSTTARRLGAAPPA